MITSGTRVFECVGRIGLKTLQVCLDGSIEDKANDYGFLFLFERSCKEPFKVGLMDMSTQPRSVL